jgi:GH25 family lysozyme M1 (1,4-beta-N-acetylmuramidase)
MRRHVRKHPAIIVTVTALAVPGSVGAILAVSEGSPDSFISVSALQESSGAGASATPAPVLTLDPSPSAPAAAPVKIVEKPPPVVDGVRRSNVGSAHSPELQQQLSTSPVTGPPPADAGALGVDVADYQHANGAAIDWPQVAAGGYKFAFVKATEGDYYANPYFGSDLAQAKAAGLYAAGYHFAIPNVSDGASQADYAVANGDYAADGHTLPLALDIEYNPYGAECYGLSAAQMVAWVSAFTGEAQRVTGQTPIIYTTADWWRTCTGDSTAFGANQLWVAAYRSGSPEMPAGWGSWTFWQYTSRGSVPGIVGHVDLSYFLSAAVRLLDPGDQRTPAGQAIQLQVTSLNAADGQSPQFTATGLPPGLSISAGGLITGTPAKAGSYQVTVSAAYSSGVTGSVTFNWTVTSAMPSPAPTTASPTPTATRVPTIAPSSPTPTAAPSSPPAPSPTPSATVTTVPPSTPPVTTPAPTPTPTSPAPTSESPSPSPSTSPSPTPTATPSPTPTPTPTDPSPSPASPSPTAPSSPPPAATPSESPASTDSPSPPATSSPAPPSGT